jgi:hypothetical protein
MEIEFVFWGFFFFLFNFAQGNIGMHLTEFKPTRLAILILLVRRVNHSTMPQQVVLIMVCKIVAFKTNFNKPIYSVC